MTNGALNLVYVQKQPYLAPLCPQILAGALYHQDVVPELAQRVVKVNAQYLVTILGYFFHIFPNISCGYS